MTDNQQPGPTGEQPTEAPAPEQHPYPPQPYPDQQPPQPHPDQQPPQPHPDQQASQPYPAQQASQPYPAQQPPQPYPDQQASQPYPVQQPPQQQYPGQQPPQPYPPQQPPQQYPGQPQYPGQAYPGEPYGAQAQQPYAGQQPYPGPQQPHPGQQPYPGPQQPYPGQQAYATQAPLPYGPAGQPPAQPKGKGPLVLGVLGGVLVLGLIAVFAIPRLMPNRTVPTSVTTTGGTQTAVAPAATGAAAVQGYLEAIASGDSESAIAFGVRHPLEHSLLTDEMLAANRAVAPITDITTTEGAGDDHQTVQATYNLGGTPVSTTFEVTRVNGAWLLDAVAAPLPLDLSGTVGVDLTINGRDLGYVNPEVFPGRYTIAASNGWYKVSGGTVQVENATMSSQVPEVKLSLTGSGVSAIRKAAQSKLNSCVKKKSLAPSGCAFNVFLPGKNKVRSSSIRWRITSGGDAMKKLKPKLDVADSAIAKVSVKSRVDCSSTNGRLWRGYGSIHYVYATLSDDKVTVTFGA